MAFPDRAESQLRRMTARCSIQSRGAGSVPVINHSLCISYAESHQATEQPTQSAGVCPLPWRLGPRPPRLAVAPSSQLIYTVITPRSQAKSLQCAKQACKTQTGLMGYDSRHIPGFRLKSPLQIANNGQVSHFGISTQSLVFVGVSIFYHFPG